MNILYVVDTFSVIEPMGVLQLSAITKQCGHTSFIASIQEGNVEAVFISKAVDVVAFSIMSTEIQHFRALAIRLKRLDPKVLIVAGGPHPTYYPSIVNTSEIDVAVIGEGDASLPEILRAYEKGEDLSHIQGIHTKKKQNPPRCLIEELDTLPFPDRELLRDITLYKYISIKTFFATRGCPYKCSYCYNSAYNEMFKGRGTIIRRRSVENLIAEIEHVIKKYPTDFIRFGDDAFILTLDEWTKEFCAQYKKRINLPFYFLIHPGIVNNELMKLLKDAGCYSCMMGIESADAVVRDKILSRHVSNEQMINAFRIMKTFDIKVFSNTILGFPSTDLSDDLQSLNFTLDLAATYTGFTVFAPFPGTALYTYSKDHGYLSGNKDGDEDIFPTSMQQRSSLNHIDEKHKDIHQNILYLAPIANLFPWMRELIVTKLIYWKPNMLFTFIGFLVRNYCNALIFPFKKSPMAFFTILKQVVKIDKGNYPRKQRF